MSRGSWRVLLVGVLIVGVSATCVAGAMYRNDSGAVARAVRIEFSEPAEITSTWPSFLQRDPQGPATVIVLSGGEVPAGGWLTFSWRPDTARVVRVEWMTSLPRPNLGFTNPKAKPEVYGDLLNSAFFAHPAYVMQGVLDREKIFALPLRGVPELKFYPVAADVPLDSLTWTFEVSHPEGIGAAIENDTLYIWGNNPDWQGYGEVRLHVVASDGRKGWVEIPVVVFCSDRTLVNPQGKKDYFVPWGVILDINRILSTEEHMRQYNKPDLGLLDRTLRFSRWRPMEFRADLDVSTRWCNELVTNGWSMATQFALVDVLLQEAISWGITGIRVRNEYLVDALDGTAMVPVYHRWNAGPTKRPEEEAYLVCEAHRLGLSVIMGNVVGGDTPNGYFELWQICPRSLSAFVANWEEVNRVSISRWTRLGVDVVQVCAGLDMPCTHRWKSYEEARAINNAVEQLANSARTVYPGPLYHMSVTYVDLFPGEPIAMAPFWRTFDIVGLQFWGLRLTPFDNPTLDQLIAGLKELIAKYIQPFQRRLNKPFLLHEPGGLAAEGCASWGTGCAYPNVGSGYDPSKPSIADMELSYLAQHIAFLDLEGYFGPGWFMFALNPFTLGSVRDTVDTTPRLKVEHILQQIHLGERRPRVITIDGNLGDWREEYLVGTDPLGDSRGPNDLKGLSFAQDDDYWYLKIDYAKPPGERSFLSIEIDLTNDGQRELNILLNNIYGEWWQNETIYTDIPGVGSIGFADAIDAESSLEIRVPKRFLIDLLTGAEVRVRLVHADNSWRVEDETKWFVLPLKY